VECLISPFNVNAEEDGFEGSPEAERAEAEEALRRFGEDNDGVEEEAGTSPEAFARASGVVLRGRPTPLSLGMGSFDLLGVALAIVSSKTLQ
jgi:hypothetical protein